jgi:hypothetical protein
MRIKLKQLRLMLREAIEGPVRMDAYEAQEYFPDAFQELVKIHGDDPDAEGAVLHGMKYYFKDGTLFTRSWDASLPTMKWENGRWEKASYN